VSRNVNPHHAAVVSITQLHAGSAYNVIPDDAHLAGTIRGFPTRRGASCEIVCARSAPGSPQPSTSR
jgi:metal-dependent amidase/aminoacylase/carboxypeptidase family protein